MHLSHFEDRINAVCERHLDLPRQAVILTRLIRFLSGAIDDRLSRLLEREGLGGSAWAVLTMIYSDRDGAARPSCIGQALSQSRAHMTRISDDLVTAGLVERVANVVDRRAVDLRLTAEGERRVQALLPQVGGLYQEMLGIIDPVGLDQLETTLRSLLGHIEHLPPIDPTTGTSA